MEYITDLVTEVETALDDDDYIEVSDLICEAFTHMSDFNRGDCEVWDWSDIKEALHEVGELIYEKDGFEYYRITDSRFKTYDDFRAYLLQYFTESFVDSNILSPENVMYTKGEDGGLYFLNAPRGTNPFYAGHTFEIDKAEEEAMGFKATAYYTIDGTAYEGDHFYEAPADPENYSTQEYLFTLWKENDAWRFNRFHLFF
jgi:hypothetical protein